VINHASIIKAIQKKVGPYSQLGKLSTYNPKTKKYFGVSDSYVPDPVVWRRDLWNGIGEAPYTWDHVRKAAPKLKAIGPHGRFGLEHVMGCYSIWKFAKNKANAEKFLADLCINYKQATIASQLYNFPSFPGAFPFADIRKVAAADPHKPKGKYTILTTIAERYTHNIGYPGTTNAAVDEVFSKYLIPQMFAQVSQGKLSAKDSVRDTMSVVKDIYAKWRKRGKI
jgi:hypothetical protein